MGEDTDTPFSELSSDEKRDVNDVVVDEWVAETTPFERVHDVILTLHDPASVAEIADEARVEKDTAQTHVRALERTGHVTSRGDEETRYHRSEISIITEHAASVLEEHTVTEIQDGIAELEAEIASWQLEYSVDSPEEFAREFDVNGFDTEHGDVLRKWRTTRRYLVLGRAAVGIGRACQTGHVTEHETDM